MAGCPDATKMAEVFSSTLGAENETLGAENDAVQEHEIHRRTSTRFTNVTAKITIAITSRINSITTYYCNYY